MQPVEPNWGFPVHTTEVIAQVEQAGTVWNGQFDLYKYTVVFDTPIEMEQGWFAPQINVDLGTSGAWFLWLNSLDGDMIAYQRAGTASRSSRSGLMLTRDGVTEVTGNRNTRGQLAYDLAFTFWGPEEEPPLPVELASFTASVTANNFVELEWVSETETNLLGYHIYRSNTEQLDDAQMANMQIIPATNTSETTVYTYVDENVEPGTYHYWLEYVDLDLTSGFHGPVTITLEEEPVLPPEVYATRLQQNFPNPFNPETTIKYSLENDVENMSIKIYNILGQEVRTLKSGPHAKGEFTVVWDGRDNSGRNATSGIYFYRMSTPTYNQVHKMMLLK
jgi:hypothetical protein